MSILQAAYNVTKLVEKTKRRSEIREVLWTSRPDLGWLPGSARQPQMIEQARSQFGAMVFLEQSPLLADEHSTLLMDAHLQIDALDRDCMSALKDWPILAHSALPYAQFSAHTDDHNRRNDLIADGRARQSLVNEFAAHPAFTLALETAQALGDRLIEADPPPAVVHLHHQIEATPSGKIQGAVAVLLAGLLKPGSSELALMRNLVALVCLRASLGVLNQLIYQKCRDDKLVFISRDNLSRVSTSSDPFSLGIYEAVMQPQRDREDRVQLGDLLLLQIGDERRLCRVEHLGLVFDSAGYDVPLRLRPIDVHLNPYSHLLASI